MSNFRIGDNVTDTSGAFKNGTIINIVEDKFAYPIIVKDEKGRHYTYTYDGYFNHGEPFRRIEKTNSRRGPISWAITRKPFQWKAIWAKHQTMLTLALYFVFIVTLTVNIYVSLQRVTALREQTEALRATELEMKELRAAYDRMYKSQGGKP
jgi:hypothetical protein